MNISLTHDLEYLALFALVLIFPKFLLRFKIPAGITALLIGTIAATLDPSISENQLFRFLSQIGITSLFVFAGLEVDFKELKEDRKYLSTYLIKTIFVMLIIATGLLYLFNLSFPSALILSLGIFTPSAGFIMSSLHSFNVSEDQEYWIKSKAISKEFISIILLFFASQANNPKAMLISIVFFIGLFLFLPWFFKFFFKFVSPYAPNSEVPMLVAISLIAGVISKELGAYYLVGAFIVGLIASKLKHEIFRESEETLFKSLSSFFSVFLPFYFFSAGLKININELTLDALYLAIALFVIFVPLRILLIRASIKFILKEILSAHYKIALSLMPTLIFGLVIAGMLKTQGEVPNYIVYALIIYTLLTSLMPSILFSFQARNKTKT